MVDKTRRWLIFGGAAAAGAAMADSAFAQKRQAWRVCKPQFSWTNGFEEVCHKEIRDVKGNVIEESEPEASQRNSAGGGIYPDGPAHAEAVTFTKNRKNLTVKKLTLRWVDNAAGVKEHTFDLTTDKFDWKTFYEMVGVDRFTGDLKLSMPIEQFEKQKEGLLGLLLATADLTGSETIILHDAWRSSQRQSGHKNRDSAHCHGQCFDINVPGFTQKELYCGVAMELDASRGLYTPIRREGRRGFLHLGKDGRGSGKNASAASWGRNRSDRSVAKSFDTKERAYHKEMASFQNKAKQNKAALQEKYRPARPDEVSESPVNKLPAPQEKPAPKIARADTTPRLQKASFTPETAPAKPAPVVNAQTVAPETSLGPVKTIPVRTTDQLLGFDPNQVHITQDINGVANAVMNGIGQQPAEQLTTFSLDGALDAAKKLTRAASR